MSKSKERTLPCQQCGIECKMLCGCPQCKQMTCHACAAKHPAICYAALAAKLEAAEQKAKMLNDVVATLPHGLTINRLIVKEVINRSTESSISSYVVRGIMEKLEAAERELANARETIAMLKESIHTLRNDWIPVTERLPEVPTDGCYKSLESILVAVQYTGQEKVSYYAEMASLNWQGLWLDDSDNLVEHSPETKVTHWKRVVLPQELSQRIRECEVGNLPPRKPSPYDAELAAERVTVKAPDVEVGVHLRMNSIPEPKEPK